MGEHVIHFEDGTVEDCFCSEGADHNEDQGDWDFTDDGDDWREPDTHAEFFGDK